MASLYRRGKRYWIGYTVNGRRVERSLFTSPPEGVGSSALPSHPPKVCLVSKHLVELLLLIWMLMLVGHRTKISDIGFKTVIGPALDELGIGPFGP